jgi:hypothetical protein
MHNIKSITQKDRYGNMFSLELFEDQGVPLMIMIPDAPDGYNGADTSNHPGEPRGTDTVPAWLTPGENVVNAEASRIPGNQEKIDQMNEEGRKIQKAQGGPIPTYAADGVEVDDKLLAAIRQVESGGDNSAVSRVGAAGPYQIMAETALKPGYGVPPISLEDRFNPVKSKEFARQYLEGIAEANPDFTRDQVITAYHSGAGNVAKGNLGAQGQAYAGKVNAAEEDAYETDVGAQIQRAFQYPLEVFGLPVDDDAPGVPNTLFGSGTPKDNSSFDAKANENNLKVAQDALAALDERKAQGKPVNEKTYQGAQDAVKYQTGLVTANQVIAETDTGDEPDQPAPDENTNNEVVSAGVQKQKEDPGFFQEATNLFLDVLGDMFPPKDLARMVINYAGSRALGYEHNGSLNYAMKDYATRAELQAKREYELIKADRDNYTAASLQKYLETGDTSDLVFKQVGSSITGQSGTRFDTFTGTEVPVYKIGTGSNAYLAVQDSDGNLRNLNDAAVRGRYEVVNDNVHDSTKIRDSFQKSLTNQVKEINRTISDDEQKLDFSTEQLASEAELLYTQTRNNFRMKTKDARILNREILGAQKDFLEDMKKHKQDPKEVRMPTSIEGYYNKRTVTLKTKGIISQNDIKETTAENFKAVDDSMMTLAINQAGQDVNQVAPIYREMWKTAKDNWRNMKSYGSFTKGTDPGYDPFIAWTQAMLVNDPKALELLEASNMKTKLDD